MVEEVNIEISKQMCSFERAFLETYSFVSWYLNNNLLTLKQLTEVPMPWAPRTRSSIIIYDLTVIVVRGVVEYFLYSVVSSALHLSNYL